MQRLGLLQPVGVTEDLELVFGERRIEAAKLIGWDTIEARVVNVSSIVEGEHDENELRKDFTVSERVAIGETIGSILGCRQGQRSDLELSHHGDEVKLPPAKPCHLPVRETD